MARPWLALPHQPGRPATLQPHGRSQCRQVPSNLQFLSVFSPDIQQSSCLGPAKFEFGSGSAPQSRPLLAAQIVRFRPKTPFKASLTLLEEQKGQPHSTGCPLCYFGTSTECSRFKKQAECQRPKNVRAEMSRARRFYGAWAGVSCGKAKVRFPKVTKGIGPPQY